MRLPLLIAALALLAPSLSVAQTAPFSSFEQDPDQPVEIESDAVEFSQDAGRVVFTGSVRAVQGDLTFSADSIEVLRVEAGREGSDGVEQMLAIGSVVLLSPEERLEGDRAEYDLDAGSLVVTGNVLLIQGGNALSAERAEIDIENGTGQFTGRVRSVFVPNRGEN